MTGGSEPHDAAARRFAAGSPPSRLVAAGGEQPPSSAETSQAPFDPLRLCIFATIALLGWLAGPAALVVFAGVGFAGYWKARKAGLTRSKCYLRDTRLVLAYLAMLMVAGLWGVSSFVVGVIR